MAAVTVEKYCLFGKVTLVDVSTTNIGQITITRFRCEEKLAYLPEHLLGQPFPCNAIILHELQTVDTPDLLAQAINESGALTSSSM
jgi:hypothetical protein